MESWTPSWLHLEWRCVESRAPVFLKRHYRMLACKGLLHEKKMGKLRCSAKHREDPERTYWLSGMQKRGNPFGSALWAKTRNREWILANYMEELSKEGAAPENTLLYASLKNGFLTSSGESHIKILLRSFLTLLFYNLLWGTPHALCA